MTYLELVNNVLVRLRENTITTGQLDSDPYYRSIGAQVNDAKDRVEDSWQWSYFRGNDQIDLSVPISVPPNITIETYELPNSTDNHYIIKGMYAGQADFSETGWYSLRQISREAMLNKYSAGTNKVPINKASEWAVIGRNPSTGNIRVAVYPQQDVNNAQTMLSDRVAHQPPLTEATDILLVPSLPVYTLATALASRERGEVGGTPTSELFALADRHLSDAIAQDSALFPNEMDWYSAGAAWNNTNLRY